MRHFLLFIGGLAAGIVLLLNLGPMILLGVSIWLLYLIFKQFMKASSISLKIMWIILGLVVLSISISNIYAVLAIAAIFILYWIYKNWHKEGQTSSPLIPENNNDPFMNFENEWQDISNKKF